jgi:hypothetical protein
VSSAHASSRVINRERGFLKLGHRAEELLASSRATRRVVRTHPTHNTGADLVHRDSVLLARKLRFASSWRQTSAERASLPAMGRTIPIQTIRSKIISGYVEFKRILL